MLTDRIRLTGDPTPDPEDIFSSALSVIFTDDITPLHGDRDHGVIYLSPRFGDLTLSLADPTGEEHRRLFSHFLWNASIQLAECIEDGGPWDVSGQLVLEFGAGTGLAGIVAALSGAREVILSDYPAKEILLNLRANVDRNITTPGKAEGVEIRVQGHEWGVLDDEFSKEMKGQFEKILVADCLWMPWQHENLLQSISWFLAEHGRAWVIGAFHTGREKVRGFFEEDALQAVGLEIEKIWERNVDGEEREWVADRGIEDATQRKRWLLLAILKRR